MVDSIQIHFCSDPGHGWALVYRSLIEELGIADQISECSYTKGKVVALEEDCDFGILIDALKSHGVEYSLIDCPAKDQSHIRAWNRFTVRRSHQQPDMFSTARHEATRSVL
jgi:hypothetical protein